MWVRNIENRPLLLQIEKAFKTTSGVQGNAPISHIAASNAITTVADLFDAVKRYDPKYQPNQSK